MLTQSGAMFAQARKASPKFSTMAPRKKAAPPLSPSVPEEAQTEPSATEAVAKAQTSSQKRRPDPASANQQDLKTEQNATRKDDGQEEKRHKKEGVHEETMSTCEKAEAEGQVVTANALSGQSCAFRPAPVEGQPSGSTPLNDVASLPLRYACACMAALIGRSASPTARRRRDRSMVFACVPLPPHLHGGTETDNTLGCPMTCASPHSELKRSSRGLAMVVETIRPRPDKLADSRRVPPPSRQDSRT